MDDLLTFDDFLALPLEELSDKAPETLIFAAGGTRRRAVLAGIAPQGRDYAQWAYNQMISCFKLFFDCGVRFIITHAIIPSQVQEITVDYREQLLCWVHQILAGDQALAGYRDLGWQTRLLGAEVLPELKSVAQRLKENLISPEGPTLWFTVTPEENTPWEILLDAVARSGARTQAEAIRAQFGEDIPPASMYIGSGKPSIFPAVVPPLLMGKMQSYWLQRPGFIVEPELVKTILYDYAVTRKTWRQDKTGRAEKVLEDRLLWEDAPILGLGIRKGPFWYPAIEQDN